MTRHIGENNDCRVIRARQSAWDKSLDIRAAGAPAEPAARMAVQVYNGGSMGSTTPAVFLGYPVDLNGAETEGGSATPVPGTMGVPVVVLHSAPLVGDVLTVYAVAGRWVGERAGGTCAITILVRTCPTNYPLTPATGCPAVGAVVTIAARTGVVVFTGATSSLGSVIAHIAAGTYVITVQYGGFPLFTYTATLTCKSGSSVILSTQYPTTVSCCGCCPLPTTLWVNWINGKQPAYAQISGGVNYGWQMTTEANVAGATTVGSTFNGGASCEYVQGSGTMQCIANVVCQATSGGGVGLAVTCSWSIVSCGGLVYTQFGTPEFGPPFYYLLDSWQCYRWFQNAISIGGDSVYGGTAMPANCLESPVSIEVGNAGLWTPNPGNSMVTVSTS